jgi:hypothetical protein
MQPILTKNDSAVLEKEAGIMGTKAARLDAK